MTTEAKQYLDEDRAPAGVDPAIPSPARLYDYYLGGTHNYSADRAAAERIRAILPDLEDAAWANRSFHQRAARWMAAERGIRQFVDIGSGLPTQGNTHQVVRDVAPGIAVVYVDNDRTVEAHATELLLTERSAAFVFADLCDVETVLGHRDTRALIDFEQPVGLLMTAVVHFVPDDKDPWGVVRRYLAALAPGSYLALSHATADKIPPRAVDAGRDEYARATQDIFLRRRAEVARFFDGLDIDPPYDGTAPDLTYVGVWHAEDPEAADSDGSRVFYCAVARKP